MPVETVVTITLAILGAIGTWTVTVALLVLWPANKFKALEALIYTQMATVKRDFEGELAKLERRVMLSERQLHRLQLKVFGFAPLAMDEMLDRLTEADQQHESGERR